MTDLHTHILPGIDDGAKNGEESLAMLRMQRQQGVDTVVLTPHFYRERENPRSFLKRREEAVRILNDAMVALPEEERGGLPRVLIGAEVAFAPNMADWDELPEFCIGETKNLLLEMPFTPWNSRMVGQIYSMMNRTGITPIIAHLERYKKVQKPEFIREILDLGVPVQVSSGALLHWRTRGSVLKMLKNGQAHLLASDCHNCTKRPPDLAAALAVVEKKLGEGRAASLVEFADELICV